MKLKNIFILALVLFSVSAFSQVDRSIDRQRNAPRTKNKKAYEKKDPVEVYMQQLDKRLKLDDFQKAAIVQILQENKESLIAVSHEDSPMAVKEEKIREITEKIDTKIIPLLSKGQLEEYNKIIKERKL
ncbi:hypothetical protein CHU92_15110 [Flavobacterium cyanobacteriorum]|uniref:Uncharacterized protein n=1 Tax=Flavobacterium cyanobacteriorum TaxID=2022802 RepID=A0A255YU72_9FLAO|nr:hypothetical protein [Flavobacterium cyanobacteriorum]OYQ31970.1 hypothetical protein CHU92_15110 [Flavobacterium cyanobacteriorum]